MLGSVAEPQGAETSGRSWSRYLQVPAPAPGRTKVAHFVIIHLEQEQANDLIGIL
jgi:hypothetical protein